MDLGIDINKIVEYIPSVKKPKFQQTVNTRLKWTGIALTLYFVLSSITAYGVQTADFEQFRFFEVVLGSKFGSLMTLGIGPLVTSGILLQLLVGSQILDWDTNSPEGREKFQSWNKFLAVLLCFVEAAAFVLFGALPVFGGMLLKLFVIIQLASGAIIVILLDEIVSKWGFGSGISLFIAAGVGSQILIKVLSPFVATCVPGNIGTCLPSAGNPPTGLLWNFIIAVFQGNPVTAFESGWPMFATLTILILVVYIQNVRVEIPLSFSSLRGFGRSWPLKLLYTSNIPVILTAALVANLQLMGRMSATPTNGLSCSILGCFDEQGTPTEGLVYYLTSSKTIVHDIVKNLLFGSSTNPDILRMVTYTIFMATLATIFSIFWVTTSGMDAESVAEQISSIGMQIPGYRSNQRVIKNVLSKYIPALAAIGGITVGLLASLADFMGALGTGTGMLLTVMIVYNYYEELGRERLDEAHPLVRKIFE